MSPLEFASVHPTEALVGVIVVFAVLVGLLVLAAGRR